MLEIGSIVDGKYKILNKVGQGGMSVVYLAMNEKANKQWAIKELRKDSTQNFEVVKQGLIVETDMLKKLSHPHLPSIVDVIDHDDTFLIVMDYIEGNTLLDALKEYGAQPQDMVIEWAKQLCDVLNYLHTRKPPIIYRDMKPANIMLKPDGNVMLIDFGTAREFKDDDKRIEDTTCLGTQGYAAPEQFGGQGQTDARTDVYCLGATMYHLVTGHNPAKPPYEMYPIRHWDENLSSGLEEIILKCTMRNPDDRYQDCNELLYALEHYNELDIEYKKREKRHLSLFLASVVMTVVCICVSVFGHVKATNLTAQTYESYIEKAGQATNDADYLSYIEDAVKLKPAKADAFNALLEYYRSDGYFNQQEAETVTRLVNENNGQMKADAAGFADFAYNMGAAYWYEYSNNDSTYTPMITQATQWFSQVEEVKVGDVSNSAKYKNAMTYKKIGENRSMLNQKADQMGDTGVSFATYWAGYVELYNSEMVNEITKLHIYKDIVTNIFSYASEFKNAGIEKDTITAMLDDIKTEVAQMDADISNTSRTDLIRYLNQNIPSAQDAITSAYDQLVEEGQ